MTEQQIAEKLECEQVKAVNRIVSFRTGGTIECEMPGCSNRIGVKTFSAIVTPEIEVLLSCADCALDYAQKHNQVI